LEYKRLFGLTTKNTEQNILTDKGKISHKQAIDKAEKEFDIYRHREMLQLESDFDRAVRQFLTNDNNSIENQK
jgi:hypothetical protein